MSRIGVAVLLAVSLPTGDVWKSHLLNDLLPWWTTRTALGDQPGSFPTVRCDDGSLPDPKHLCPEVARNAWIDPFAQSLVALSRQTYAYGVAFHITGDPKYLDYMKEGVEYIRANAIDKNGTMFEVRNAAGEWGPPRLMRDPQQLGYGLLGLSFYYYLTRDPAVLPDILTVQHQIFQSYWNRDFGQLQWLPVISSDSASLNRQLVAQLDQMNTYHVLLAPILPEPWGSDWRHAIRNLSGVMLSNYYSKKDQLFFLSANSAADRDLAQSGTDFGHNAKATWMIRFAAQLTNDPDRVAWAEANGKQLLERAYLADSGSWAEGVLKGGAIDKNKNWWIYAELDQLAATLALTDPDAAKYLPQTHDYWFRYFVDHQYGEVWNGVDAATNLPQRDMPKQWTWKNGYHSLEHALVSFIACSQLHNEPVTLYYAFRNGLPEASLIRPYYFTGKVAATKQDGRVWKVDFTGVK